MSEAEIIKQILLRERKARKAAEQIMEEKSLELFELNQKLQNLNTSLESELEWRTQEIRKNEEKYRNIIENMELGFLEVDPDDVITDAYPKFCALSGYSKEELLGKKAIETLLPIDFQDFVRHQNNYRKDGSTDVYEVQLKRKDGNLIWVLISAAPYYSKDGSLAGSVGIHLDITDRKEIENELREAKDIAESTMKSKELFMANMSHEIRTPMNAIIGMSDLLMKSELSGKQQEYIDAINTSADNLLIIIDDILDFSKIESGNLGLEKIPVNLPKIIHDAIKTVELRAEEKGLLLTYTIEPNINGYIADPTRLNQILLNLLSNGVKYTNHGSVTLSCSLLDSTPQNDTLRISIKDTGIGIKQDQLRNIFKSFIQAEESTTRKYGGTGLGLAIARQLVNLMDGELEVNSTLGKGSEFYFIIPLERTNMQEKIQEKVSVDTSALKGVSVLLVEDHQINRFMAQTILENWECKIDIAVNGLEAVEKVRSKMYDVILMDVQMPEMNGIEATKFIREQLKSDTPIIALTANAIKGDNIKCIEAGMNDYVSKPFKQEELSKKLLQHYTPPKEEHKGPEKKQVEEDLVDLTLLKKSIGDNQEFIRKMIQLFIDDGPKQIEEIENAIENNNVNAIKAIAHRLAPSIEYMANKNLQIQVRTLDKESSNTTLDLAKDFCAGLKVLIKQLEKEI